MSGLVFDLGMNNGDDTAFYLASGSHVIAVEANPLLARQAEIRFAREIKAGLLQILNKGISSQEGEEDFWVCQTHSQFSSFNRESASRDDSPHYRVRVPTIRLQTLFRTYGVPSYLKIDIEGNELLCLDELVPGSMPKYVSLECDSFPGASGEENGLRVLAKLRALGYRYFKFINQYTFCSVTYPCSITVKMDSMARKILASQWNRIPGIYRFVSPFVVRTRLARRHDREFPPGASGPWGEDTDGRWISYSQAEKALQHYKSSQLTEEARRPFPFWYDWHARL
jgi:FkbM family methyltransferase